MWMLKLSAVALAIQVVSAATILDSIHEVDGSTGALGSSVKSWKGNFLGTLPIIGASTVLLGDINDGTKTAKASAPLTLDEALDVAGATISLGDTVNSTLQAVIDRRPDFQKLLLGPVILGTLEMQKSATDRYTAAVLEKVPQEAQAIARDLIGDIESSFQKALDAYKLF
ncbi:hypothetical protein NLU13_7350 [Sarocladium strictum]|uniref:Antigenic cell wall galactomannoprotein n=1 Tax=Sarocladium strictum TaxID=5046 RepID=A0AA39L5H4_SARSR|nr:hypothetical protein NLU13_7350 [Sarocladium strictum]